MQTVQEFKEKVYKIFMEGWIKYQNAPTYKEREAAVTRCCDNLTPLENEMWASDLTEEEKRGCADFAYMRRLRITDDLQDNSIGDDEEYEEYDEYEDEDGWS